MKHAIKKPLGSNPRASQNIVLFPVRNPNMANPRPVDRSAQEPQTFASIPAIGKAIYSVNRDVSDFWLIGEATFIADATAECASAGVELGISSAQAWMIESNCRRIIALLNTMAERAE